MKLVAAVLYFAFLGNLFQESGAQGVFHYDDLRGICNIYLKSRYLEVKSNNFGLYDI